MFLPSAFPARKGLIVCVWNVDKILTAVFSRAHHIFSTASSQLLRVRSRLM